MTGADGSTTLQRWTAPAVVLVAGLVVGVVDPVVRPPPPGAEPLLAIAALGVLGMLLLPATVLMAALDRAPTTRRLLALTAALVAAAVVSLG